MQIKFFLEYSEIVLIMKMLMFSVGGKKGNNVDTWIVWNFILDTMVSFYLQLDHF